MKRNGTNPSLKRRLLRAGGWTMARRLIKPIPVIGTAVVISMAGYDIKKKGLLRGGLHVGLDATPIIGTAKGILELFTGDLIPDKKPRRKR
ncbi:MAG: hypothetical protein JO360_05510 [Acidobacteria bacterium]|nr:hypothetical protein [Acidobacteriota bacterium]